MEQIAENEGRIYASLTIERPEEFVTPFPGSLFPCLIWDHRGDFSPAQIAAVAGALLDAGCRYAVCGGKRCEAWHDAIDVVFVERHLDDPEERRESMNLMTTWHDGEGPDDVATFFVLSTNFQDHHFTRYLVLHVGAGEQKSEVDSAVRKYVVGEHAL